MMKEQFCRSHWNVAKVVLGLTIVALLWGAPTSVHATGADASNHEIYTEDNRPDYPAFNALEGKQNFLSVETEDGQVFMGGVDTLELTAGHTYNVKIAYCNDGLPRGIPNAAYAHGSKVKAHLPSIVDGEQSLTAFLSATDTQPSEISCALTVTSEVPLQLEFVSGSARIFNGNKTNNSPVSASDLFGAGADFGTNSMTGIVLYGEEYSGTIEFSFTTSLVNQEDLWSEEAEEATPTVTDIPLNEPAQDTEEVPTYLYLLLVAAIALLIVAVGYGLYYSLERRNRRYR